MKLGLECQKWCILGQNSQNLGKINSHEIGINWSYPYLLMHLSKRLHSGGS